MDAAPVGIVCPLCLSELWPGVSVNIEHVLVNLPVQLVQKIRGHFPNFCIFHLFQI